MVIIHRAKSELVMCVLRSNVTRVRRPCVFPTGIFAHGSIFILTPSSHKKQQSAVDQEKRLIVGCAGKGRLTLRHAKRLNSCLSGAGQKSGS